MLKINNSELYERVETLLDVVIDSERANDLSYEHMMLTRILYELDHSDEILLSDDVTRYQRIIELVQSNL